jgi:hypothetical protein
VHAWAGSWPVQTQTVALEGRKTARKTASRPQVLRGDGRGAGMVSSLSGAGTYHVLWRHLHEEAVQRVALQYNSTGISVGFQ